MLFHFPWISSGGISCHCLSGTWQRKIRVPSLQDHQRSERINISLKGFPSKCPVNGMRYSSGRRAAGPGLGWGEPWASHPSRRRVYLVCSPWTYAACMQDVGGLGALFESEKRLCLTSQHRSKRKAKTLSSGDGLPFISKYFSVPQFPLENCKNKRTHLIG